MITFARILELMEMHKLSPQKREESKSINTVRNGLNLDNDSFWENFKTICGDAAGLSELLGVPKEKIIHWPRKIDEIIKFVNQSDDESSKEVKSEILPTGEYDFGNPNGADAADIADTRPMT